MATIKRVVNLSDRSGGEKPKAGPSRPKRPSHEVRKRVRKLKKTLLKKGGTKNRTAKKAPK